jgi:hypothetical protein
MMKTADNEIRMTENDERMRKKMMKRGENEDDKEMR